MPWGCRLWSTPIAARTAFVAGLVSMFGAGAPSAPSAAAAPGLFVGVTEDAFRWRSAEAVAVARDLGLSAIRLTLTWSPSQTAMTSGDADQFGGMVTAAFGLRIVVTVAGSARAAPVDPAARNAYCAYLRDVLERYPTINDIVIWNEPNLGHFWQPQYTRDRASAAPAGYAALLARCWDTLHAVRPHVNVLTTTSPRGNDDPAAVTNVSHSPASFVRKLGAAYRASGRRQPIFDTVGHNPYGSSSAEPPWQKHLAASHIAQGDLDRLVTAFADGFRGTAQPVPGRCVGVPPRCASVWYLEAGYQTVPDDTRRGYFGRENDAQPIHDAATSTQSTQLRDGIRLAYCQPYVGAFFNFLLWDEPDLARWQSGVLWADGGRKASYEAVRAVVAEVGAGKTDCAALWARAAARPSLPRGDALVERVEWTPVTSFSAFNEVWWFGIGVRADSTYRAAIVRLRSATRKVMLSTAGRLRRVRPRVVRFPLSTLRPGVYRIEVVVKRQRRPRLTVTRRSPTFVVK